MSVLVIIATIECDECGKRFRVEIEAAAKPWPRENGTAFDLAENAVRGGGTTEGPACSVRAGQMLCGDCTKDVDEKHAESRLAGD